MPLTDMREWVGQRRRQLMAPSLPMVPCKAHAIGFGGAAVGFLVLGAEMQPIKKQRGGRVLSLRWSPFGWENTTTNQKLVFAVGKILGRVRNRGETCWGAFRYRLGAANTVTKNKTIKYVVASDGRQSAKKHTTTNQKQVAVTEVTMEGRRDEREAWGSAISLFFRGGGIGEVENYKLIAEFSKYFFSRPVHII